MGASILKLLKNDQQDLREAISEQERTIADAQATSLRLDGALVYINKLIEHIEQRKPKEIKDAISS